MVSRITVHHSAVVLRDNRKTPTQLRTFRQITRLGAGRISPTTPAHRSARQRLPRPALVVRRRHQHQLQPERALLVVALGNPQVQEVSSASSAWDLAVAEWPW